MDLNPASHPSLSLLTTGLTVSEFGFPTKVWFLAPAVLMCLNWNLPFPGAFTCHIQVRAGHWELPGLPPSRPDQNWWNPTLLHWKPNWNKAIFLIFFFFFEVSWTNLFLSGREDRKFVCSPKSNIRDFMSLGVCLSLLSRENPEYPKWSKEVTAWAHTHWEEEAETGFQQTKLKEGFT